MPRYTWHTSPNDVVFVSDNGGPLVALVPGPKMAALMDDVIAKWAELARRHEERVGVGRNRTLAMIGRESGGNPLARNHEDPPGLGLMQITSPGLYRGLTYEQVMDPETNVRIGTDFLADIDKHQPGRDLPSMASVYNAGGWGALWLPHPDTNSPWGYRETRGHIVAEVCFSNYELGKRLGVGVLLPTLQIEDAALAQAMNLVDLTLWDLAGDVIAEADAATRAERLAAWPDESTNPNIKKQV